MMESCMNDKVSKAETIVVEDLKRDLYYDLMDIAGVQDSGIVEKELLQVYLRMRPFTSAEMENGESQDCVTIHPPDTVLLKAPTTSLSARLSDKSIPQTAQRFQFSQVFGPDTSQKDIFDGTVKSLVRDVLEGKNSLVFTYGITNSGKTFTFLGPENDAGVLPRSLNMMFSCLGGRVFTHMSVKPHRCQEVLMLTREQQIEEALGKRNLLRLLKENDAQKSMTTLLSSQTLEEPANLDINLDTDLHTKFSVWVSFCEIYNENIHDLLEQLPANTARRTNLRLCQDSKNNSFIKDLRWVQVHSADEAFRVMKLGKRNQSIFSTKLNQLSSRSHSIFSVRILRIEDVDTPRVLSVSELSLCDLAGSERCGKTQNKGDRLKEAGSINTSLLSLGKCINALRNSQQARHHVPFRESKLTHYLQGYFTGRGKACMIVNINQCASMYDETLSVLKFSAVAQKVVVLTTATVLPLVVKRSAREVSFIINKASQREARRTSLLRWEHSQQLDDEDMDDEEDEESCLQDTLQDMDDSGKETVLLDKEVYESQLMLVEELREQLQTAKQENYTLECRIREEVAKEFSELFSQMQADYNERIVKDREIVEERCERRLEIFKQLVGKTSSNTDRAGGQEDKGQARESPSLDGMLNSMCSDLAGIRQDAEAAQCCLVTSDPQPSVILRDLEKKVAELSEQLTDAQRQLSLKAQELDAQNSLSIELEEMKKSHQQRMSELMVMCVEKDDIIAKVQASLDQAVEDMTKNSALIKDLLQLKENCTCSEHKVRAESRKRRQEREVLEELHGPPPLKKGSLKDSSIPQDLIDDEFDESPVLEVRGHFECQRSAKRITDVEQERQTPEICVQKLKSQLGEKPSICEKEFVAEQSTLHCSTDEHQQNLLTMEVRLGDAESDYSKLKACLEAKTVSYKEELNGIRCQLTERDHEIDEKNAQIRNLKQEVAQQKQEEKAMEQQLTKHQAVNRSLQRENSELQAEVATLRGVIAGLEETIGSSHAGQRKMGAMEEDEAALLTRKEIVNQSEARLTGQAQPLKEPASNRDERGSEFEMELTNGVSELAQKKAAIAEKEVKLQALQKRLQEAEARLGEEVQAARRREVERRRELLKVAEEAIAQKDAEVQKRQDDINKLKEEVKINADRVKSLSVDLNRREDDSADLREKLVDSKKQIQQVQNEISSLKQKLGDVEKAKTQLQNELCARERLIQQLRSRHRSSESKAEHVQLYEKALKDLEGQKRVVEDMRLALTEQEETQTQLDLELDNRETQIHELTKELENLKEMVVKQGTNGNALLHHDTDGHIHGDLKQAREQTAQTQQCLQMANEKHQAERQKWLEEKMALIAQAKEAEERRNKDMRRFADDRERYARQQAEMGSLTAQLQEREQEMERWRTERDALVSALEVQLQKLISSIAEKDKQIQQLQCSGTSQPPEGAAEGQAAEQCALLTEREAKIHSLELQFSNPNPNPNQLLQPSSSVPRDSYTQTVELEDLGKPGDSSTLRNTNHTRPSVTSQGSCCSCPSVLDSSEISMEAGQRSRFPRPELEISFSPVHPDRLALKRPGEEVPVMVKIARAGRKRKSSELEKTGVESENRRNMRSKNTLPAHQEEPSPEVIGKGSHDSQSSLRGQKEGTLQKIGDFLHSSPTFLGSKAKKIMGLMSGKSPGASGASQNLKRSKRKPSRPDISSPMDIPAHQIIGGNPEDNNHVIIKRRLRTRTPK